jgi:hypothetical protein
LEKAQKIIHWEDRREKKVSSIEKPNETNFIHQEARDTNFIHIEARLRIKSSVEKADGNKFIQREARLENFIH